MTPKEFLKRHGRGALQKRYGKIEAATKLSRAEKVAIEAGITYGFFKLVVYGSRRASPDAAARLVEASDGELDFMSLVSPTTKVKKKPIKEEAILDVGLAIAA